MPKIPQATNRRQARNALDPRLARAREAIPVLAVPRIGWIRAIRNALGMSAADLATRMDITTSTVLRMEVNEARGNIHLDSLRRAAEALNCDLVYALVPRESLSQSVRRQATKRAEEALAPVQHTMHLEDQAVPKALAEDLLEQEIAAWQGRLGLWHE